MVVVKPEGSEAANVLTAVSKTASAGICHLIAAYRALVAGDRQNLDRIGVLLVAAHSHLDTLVKNSSLFIDTATHCRLISRDNLLGNVQQVVIEGVVPCFLGNLS